MKRRTWKLAALMFTSAFLMLGTRAEAMEDVYRVPQLSGVIKTWVYQGETFDQNWNRILADDQEDGDLTKTLTTSGTVNTSTTGTYDLKWSVLDSDKRKAELTTSVTVLDKNTATAEDKKIQRMLYTIPDASHLTDIGFNRGYYHDRQNLGIWMPAGTSIKIRIVNAEAFGQSLSLQFANDDSETESSTTIPSDGSWVTLSNTKNTDSVPFITTPKATSVQPIIEYEWEDNFAEIPYYRYGDSQEAFFKKWEDTQAPFAILEGSAATFLVPICDKDHILHSSYGNKKDAYRFETLDDMLEWYAAFVKQYDAYSGLDFYAKDPWNQNVRAKFFIKANAHGVGQAYYARDNSAYNGKSLQTYLVRDWISLHEFGHGYEGAIASRENPFVETTNNILGYYFEPTYRPEEDFGWMLGDFSGTQTERYQALGEKMDARKAECSSFSDIVAGACHYNVSLFMFTNLMDKLGPQKAVSKMHSEYREYYYKTGTLRGSSDAVTDSLSSMEYNVLPYFDTWYITPSGRVENEIYDTDKPMLYYLNQLIPDETACESVRAKLGLDSIYSLVTTADLAQESYTSKVKLQIKIDDLEQIKGRKLLIKDGEKIVRELTVTSADITVELPVGIYEVEMPSPKTKNYKYPNEYLAAASGEVSKTLTYTKQTGNPLADDARIQLLGLGDAVVSNIRVDSSAKKLIWSVNSLKPHEYLTGTYIDIKVETADGKELLHKDLQADVLASAESGELDFPIGSKLILYHKESRGRLLFNSDYTGENLSGYQISAADQTITYIMTEKGLMQSDWDDEKQMRIYQQTLEAYSEYLLSNMGREDIADQKRSHNEKTTLLLAYELLDAQAKKEYQDIYGVLIGKESEVTYGYAKINSEKLQAFADSEHPGETAANAVDGDPDTIWHSNYGGGVKADIENNENNTFTILLDENTDIGKLSYLPRSIGNNGIILDFELSYSTTEEGENFQKLSIKGVPWTNNNTEKSVTFDASNARRLRLTVKATNGNPENQFISAAEFYLYEKYNIYSNHTYLSDLFQTPDANGNTVKEDTNGDGKKITLTVNGEVRDFAKGIGMKSGETAKWDLSGINSDVLLFWSGVEKGTSASAIVKIYGDETLLYTTDTLTSDAEAEAIYLSIKDVKELKICAEAIEGACAVSLADAKLGNIEDKKVLSLKRGDSAIFLKNTEIQPQDRGKVTFSSNAPEIVSVDESGRITAQGIGEAIITASFEKESITCRVTVQEQPKPSEPDTKPTEPDTKPTEPDTKPTEPDTKPTEPDTKPTEPDTKPTEPDTKPTLPINPDTKPNTPSKPAKDSVTKGTTIDVNGVRYIVTNVTAQGGTAAVAKQVSNTKTVVIANEVKILGKTFQVTEIQKNAFKNNKKIQSLSIGKNVTKIGKASFFKCNKLKKVTFKGTQSVKISAKAFKGTSAKMKVTAAKNLKKATWNKLKKSLKKSGISKKTVYKKK